MSNFSKFSQRAPAALLIAIALAACGGGGGGSGNPPAVQDPVPSAQPDQGAAELNKPVTLAVLGNDSITNNGKLALSSVTAAAHGTATISGDKIVYTPAAGFFGKDSFSYTVKDAGVGAASATGQVDVNVTAKLTLTGKVVDIPGAVPVTIAVGATVVNATTDASGNFSAPVTLDTPASMITITAQGTGERAFVKLASLAGDSQLAVTAAGSGATLSPAQLPGLNVTSFTTALYANLVRKNGGVAPATQAMLDTTAANITWNEYTQVATTLRRLTGKAGGAPTRPFPAGTTDTLALVLNAALYTEFVKHLPTDDILVLGNAMAEENALGSVPSLTIDKTKSMLLFNNTVCCANPVPELVLNPDGTGSFFDGNVRHAGTWLKNDALTFTLNTPAVRDDVLFNDLGQFDVQYITKQFKILQTTGAGSSGFVNMRRVDTLHYTHGEYPDSVAPDTTEPFVFAEWAPLSSPTDIAGTTLAGLVDPASIHEPSGSVQIVVAFAADGSATSPQLPGLAISWKMQDGKLVIDYGSGRVHTLARFRTNAIGLERWLMRAGEGAEYTPQELTMVKVQPALAFTEANAVQHWRNNPSSLYIGSHTNIVVTADFLAGEDTQAADGTISSGKLNSWLIEGGKLVIRSYRTASGATVGVCPTGEACTLRTQRTWTMIRNDGNVTTVLESYLASPTQPARQRVIQFSHS